jgi:excisionase family DNA binding protein
MLNPGYFYTVREAADLVGLEYKTLLQRIARGKVKYDTLGRMKLIPATEVERLSRERVA